MVEGVADVVSDTSGAVDVGSAVNVGQSMSIVVCGAQLGVRVGVGPKSRFAETNDAIESEKKKEKVCSWILRT